MLIFPLVHYFSYQLNVDSLLVVINTEIRIIILCDSLYSQIEKYIVFCTFFGPVLTYTDKFLTYFIRHFDESRLRTDWIFPLFLSYYWINKFVPKAGNISQIMKLLPYYGYVNDSMDNLN